MTFATTGTPYFLNAWTDKKELLIEYTSTSGSTTLPVILKKHETRIIKFTKSMLLRHDTASSDALLGYKVQLSGVLIQAKVAYSNVSSAV